MDVKEVPAEIKRLEKRIESLSRVTRKTGALRVGVFCFTILLGVGLERYHLPLISQLFTVAGLSLFGYLVFYHGRIDRALSRFRLRLAVAMRQRAVNRHDWDNISELPKWETKPDVKQVVPRHLLDLDFINGHSVLRMINRTISRLGYEKLFQVFSNERVSPEVILKRQKLVQELLRIRVLRKRFLVIAAESASAIDSQRLLELLDTRLAQEGAGLRVALLWAPQLVAQVLFAISMVQVWPRYFLIPSMAVLVLYPWALRKIDIFKAYTYALSLEGGLKNLAALIDSLERMGRTRQPHLTALLEPFTKDKNLKALSRKTATIMGALGARQNYLVHLGVQFLFPWDCFFTVRLEKVRKQLEAVLPSWLTALAELEVFISLAEYAEANPDYCVPTFTGSAESVYVQAKKLAHPLIPAATRIGNDFTLSHEHRCHLITGSNMAGKSTFLRTVGVNFLLAKAGTTVCAEAFQFSPDFGIETSLRLSDSLEEGFSSFYAEVRTLKSVLDRANSGQKWLYFIDEIFRGTNNRERLVGSRAYIQALAKTQAAGLITTHDLELAQLAELNPAIQNFHFQEDIEGEKMLFRYRLVDGPSVSTNALRVMKLAGLPVEG